MKAKLTGRGGIERKFVTSILWVGFLPMALALVISFWFAGAGQRDVVAHDLSSAAYGAVRGAVGIVESRAYLTERLSRHPDLPAALAAAKASEAPDLSGLRGEYSLDQVPRVALYDEAKNLIYPADGGGDVFPQVISTAASAELKFSTSYGGYLLVAVAPIYESNALDPTGFLAEAQVAEDLVTFVLGREVATGLRQGGNRFELLDLTPGRMKAIGPGITAAEPWHERSVDPQLLERIDFDDGPFQPHGTVAVNRFEVDGQVLSALVAHRSLLPGSGLHVLVYRPNAEIFSGLYQAAAWTILLCAIVIGGLWIQTYRRVDINIIRPVALLNEGAQIIRQGDLELKLKIDTGDEIEELASSFNKMAAALSHNINQLEESEERYRSLITSMRDGIYQTNKNWEVTLINPAGVDILGFRSAAELSGKRLSGYFIDESDFARINEELAQNEFAERTRVWMKKSGAAPICVEISANSIFGESGELRGIEGLFRDVTQNVRLEEKARERSERIDAINQIANAINSSLEAGRVYESIVVEVRRLVYFDYADVALLKESRAGGQPASPVESAGGHAEDFEFFQLWPELSKEAIDPGPVDNMRNRAVWVTQQENSLFVEDLHSGDAPFAEQFPEEIRSCLCVPLYATGRIIGTLNLGCEEPGAFGQHEIEVLDQMTPHVAVAIRNAKLLDNLQHSLEEVTRARENLHEAIEELKTLDEMKTNLLSNVSHELRTPLVAVMGYTDMILNGKVGHINDVQVEYLTISLRNIDKLVTLIENLLDFSRLHRGDEEMIFDTFNVVDCARMSMQIIRPLSDGRDIELILKSTDEQILVEGDKGKLGQVFNNLLSNAVKFNSAGGNVTIDIQRGDENVEVNVTDTGIGIPEEAQDKIFTRFYQYDGSSTRKYGGTGIGLSIAQDIMRLHGSRILVSSVEGEGAHFSFSLPLAGIRDKRSPSGAPQVPLPTETHLLIELVTQDRALSAQIRQLLLSEGMDVIHAAFPSVCVTLAEKYSPDCILVDTESGPLGSEVVDEILGHPTVSALPIILMTNDDKLYAKYEAEVAGRVKRGFRKSTLLSSIHYALSKGVPTGEQLGDKILCVDDDQEIVNFIVRCLESEGYEVDHCPTGEDALSKVETGDYWLVLLDISMPGMDGWETCGLIKSNPELAGILVHMVTAKPMDKSLGKVAESGADGYMLKPFRAEDFVSQIQDLAAHRRARVRKAGV